MKTSQQQFDALPQAVDGCAIDHVTTPDSSGYRGQENVSEMHSAVSAAPLTPDISRSISDGLTKTIAQIEGTERLVPPSIDVKVPPFDLKKFPRYGEAVLLVVPTENKAKKELIVRGIEKSKPIGVTVHSLLVPFDSGVGEQPYNEAGVLGAHTRISNAARHLQLPRFQEMMVSKAIGTVLIASIESFIQLENVEDPTDYGLVVIYNASTGETVAKLSCGVTVPPEYVDRARCGGFDGNTNYGRVTVGQVLAAHIPGLDKTDFHRILALRSRYDLLAEAIGELLVPW